MSKEKTLSEETWEETKAKCGCDRCTGKEPKLVVVDTGKIRLDTTLSKNEQIALLLREVENSGVVTYSTSRLLEVLKIMNGIK